MSLNSKLKSRPIESFFTPKIRKTPTSSTKEHPIVVDSDDKENNSTTIGSPSVIAKDITEVVMLPPSSSPFKTPAHNTLPGKRKQPFTSELDIEGLTESELATSQLEEENTTTSPIKPTSSRKKLKASNGKPIAYIKTGKVIFSEKKLSLEGHPDTVTELGKFFAYISTVENTPEEFPRDFYKLLGLLIQDCDCSRLQLAKRVQSKLFPASSEVALKSKKFPLQMIENAIDLIAERVNYGLADAQGGSIWRWEVKCDLPHLIAAMLEERKMVRLKAKEALEEQLNLLSDAERELVMSAKKNKEVVERVKQMEREHREKERQELKLKKEAEKQEKLALKQKEKVAERTKKISKKESTPSDKKCQPKISGFFIKTKKDQESSVAETRVKMEIPKNIIIGNDFDTTFPQFPIREDVKMAPVHSRRVISIDSDLGGLETWRTLRKHLLRGEMKLGSVALEAKSCIKNFRVKLLQFHENYRPAYYGTWNKESALISGRKPFMKDEQKFDYEYESDLEWEEGDDEGEECLTDEDDCAEEEEDDEDNCDDEDGWLVPHGYLSEGEGIDEDESVPNVASNNNNNNIMKKGEPLIPIVEGPFFTNDCPEFLRGFKIRFIDRSIQTPLDPLDPPMQTSEVVDRKPKFSSEQLENLVGIIIDNSGKGVDKLVEEFRLKHGEALPKSTIAQKIKEIAVKEKRDGASKPLWHVVSSPKEKTLL